jgi:hypothetical protein
MQLRSAALLLLLSPVAMGQAASPSSPKTPQKRALPAAQAAKPATGENTSVAPDAPVITITETCENAGTQPKSGSECKTVVTRAQFERLANALQPNMPDAWRTLIPKSSSWPMQRTSAAWKMIPRSKR